MKAQREEVRKQREQIEELARKEGFGSAGYDPQEGLQDVRQAEQFS